MKKIFTSMLLTSVAALSYAQWSPAAMRGEVLRENVPSSKFYSLDMARLRSQLSGAQEMSKGGKTVEVSLPTLDGKVERFSVYSFPVVAQSLADEYDLHSYVGVGLDDPSKYVRFSVAPNDFQSMIIKDGKYQFIEPANKDKSVYAVHAKTHDTDSKLGFQCTTTESLSEKDIRNLEAGVKTFPYSNNATAKLSDQKYRTMRLAMSVTGEYTKYFGGVAAALAQVNATMTRVNGVYEKELALHLIVQYFPQLIYTDPDTDPYSPAAQMSNWNLELQKTLTSVVGEANYDIGHLFGATGGGGNAGCIGCICISPTVDANGVPTANGKGSGITSPADAKPFGDNFDIDYVAHEMGHQLGGNHTFTHKLESGTGVNVEPGSGTTIMGYAGITGSTTDVQAHSDPWFHTVSINQIQANLISKTCDVETASKDTPPVIAPMADINIPKGTAFYLTASATDAENDPLLYSWEQVDNSSVVVNKNNLGTTTTGPNFRVQNPTASPTRFFPKLEQVLAGVLNNANNTWEAVSTVARTTNFQVLVRENNANNAMQQTQNANQKVIVGNDGPFKVTSTKVFYDAPSFPITWDVVNTTAAPYNVANVKIDYTTDEGATWVTLADSTPNDGTENFNFSALPAGTKAKIRISAIGNVFYAIGTVTSYKTPVAAPDCPTLTTPADNATSVAYKTGTLNWTAPTAGEALDSYDVYLDTNPNPTTLVANTTGTTYTYTNLAPSTTYYWKVLGKNTIGYSAGCTVFSFKTADPVYCTAGATSTSTSFEKINNVKFADIDKATTSYSGYEDLTSTVGNVAIGTNNQFTATGNANTYTTDQVLVWIDLNGDKDFDDAGEQVFVSSKKVSPWTGNITIPANTPAITTRMRVRLVDSVIGSNLTPCGTSTYGQVEDYTLKISPVLGTSETSAESKDISVFPNPADDVLNVSKVSAKAAYAIYSISGTLVSKGNLTDGKVNVSQLTKGMYVITVNDGTQKFTSKFLKK